MRAFQVIGVKKTKRKKVKTFKDMVTVMIMMRKGGNFECFLGMLLCRFTTE